MCMKCFIILYGAALSLHLQLSPEARDKTELRREQLVVVKESEVVMMKENGSRTKKTSFFSRLWTEKTRSSFRSFTLLFCWCLLLVSAAGVCVCVQ